MNFHQFRQEISRITREKKYPEALGYFKEHGKQFSREEVASNEYLVSDILNCLRKTNEFDKALNFIKYLNISINSETPNRVLHAYGWVLYSKIKKEGGNDLKQEEYSVLEDDDDDQFSSDDGFPIDKSELITRIEETLPLIDMASDYGYTLFSFLFLTTLKTEKKKGNPNWKFINEFCAKVDPEQLQTKCETIQVFRKGEVKDMELASDKEYWYAYKTKALLKVGEFQECYELSKKALELFDKFHYSNDVWFARRIALSKKHLGRSEEAISELLAISRRKKEWYIQKEIAELYFEKNDLNNALKYTIIAVNGFGELEFKIDLIYLIGKILRAKGESELAYKHYYLSKFIRQKEDWRIPQKLTDSINELQLPAYLESNFEQLKKELKEYWQSSSTSSFHEKKNKFQRRPPTSGSNGFVRGKIDKILHNDAKGIDGFIKTERKQSVYFRLNPDSSVSTKIILGAEVEFIILPAKDGKRERATSIRLSRVNESK